MHEQNIMENVMKIVTHQVTHYPGKRVTRIHLVIGALRAVMVESLEFYFQILRVGTPAESAQLVISELPIRAYCQQCHAEFEVVKFNFICPACNSKDTQIKQGQELYIDSLEVS
jgi:hydrogenase nickel incorporation protein HypA/HybF